MKPKTLLVLLILVVGLGGFIWFFEKDMLSTEERAAQDKKLLGSLKTDEVTAVTIVRDGKTVRLEREAKPNVAPAKAGAEVPAASAERPWRLTQPLQARADRFAVDRLVDSIAGLGKDRTLSMSDRKELGLNVPRARVTLTAGGADTVIEIGAPIPASSNMAVAIAGQEPVIVSNAVFTDLSKDAGDWRAKELFPGQREDITRIQIQGGETPIVLVKKGDEFRLEAPVADRADRDAVNALLGDLSGLQAAKFIDGPAAEAGAWRGTIAVETKGQAGPWQLEIGPVPAIAPPAPGASPDSRPPVRTLVRAGGVLAETESKIADTLAKSPASWRSTRWASFEVFRVEGFDVTDAKGPLSLRRKDADWKRGSERIAFTPVSDLLYAVTGARGDRLLSRADAVAAGAQLAKPVVTVKLIAADQSEETLTLYPSLPDGTAPAMASGRDGVVSMLNKTFVDDLLSKVQALRAAPPLAAKSDEGAGKQG